MSYGRNAYIGADEVDDLIGKWQQIVGSDWQQIVGADVYQRQFQGRRRRRHRRPFPGYPPVVPAYNPYAGPAYSPMYNPYAAPVPVPGYGYQPSPPIRSLRDQRRAWLKHRAFVRGDSEAIGALALMGAEDAEAEATGTPPVDATIPASPPPMDMANMGPMGAPAEDDSTPDEGPPPGPPPMAMQPPPVDMGPPERRRRRHRWQERAGYGIQPRNALIDYPNPTRAERVVLPMSSGVNILPNTSAQITSRPQTVAFRPERMIIGGNAGDWIINDVKVGNRSQFTQSGDVPGEMFAATTIDSFVSFETVQTAMDFVVLVTFIGASESGAPFVCGVLGTAAV